jgi:predicted metal-dependent hydrolase
MYDYTLIRSDRTTVSLEVTGEGGVLVRAPEKMPKSRIDRLVEDHGTWIARHLRLRQDRQPPPTPEEIAALKARAKELLPPRVAYYSRLMGLTPTGIRITSARGRYGSCSGRDSLCFSCFLMNSPEEAVDLVIVHELCHIRHKNHGPQFYALLESVLPDWKARKAQLRMR